MRISALSSKSFQRTAIVMLAMIMLIALSMFLVSSQAKAEFASGKPDLSVSDHSVSWVSYSNFLARNLTVNATISNSAANDAYDVKVTGATATNGVTLLTTFPVSVGNIDKGSSATATLNYHVLSSVGSFHTQLSGTALDVSGTEYSYVQSSDLMDLAYIENTGGVGKIPTVDVLDMTTMSIVNKFEDVARTGSAQGHFIAVSPDGRYIWHNEDAGPTTGYVEVLDAVTGVRVPGKKWDVGAGVGYLMTKTTIAGGHHYAFSTNSKTAAPSLTVFDVESQAYLGEIPMPSGSAPHLIIATPDENTLWTYTGSGTTSRAISFDITGITKAAPGTEVIPTAIKDSVTIGGSLHAMVMHPNGKYLFMGSGDAAVNIAIVDIDPANGAPHVEINNTTGIGTSHNFTISPDESHLLVGETGAYT